MILNIIGIVLILMFAIFNWLLIVIYLNIKHIVASVNVMLAAKMKFDDLKSLFSMLKERWQR